MSSHELIDAQFDHAVQIVQSLPKTGPIQTDYEEKLQMYSLYKQATVGNVTSPRPGIFDMLGRAKWDAWAKHQDLNSYEAKWLYVEALLKVLRKYSDKTIARDLVRELESYGGDPSNLVLSQYSKSPQSTSTGSTTSDEQYQSAYPPQADVSRSLARPSSADSVSESESELGEDEPGELPPSRTLPYTRPQSSHSTHRYRTPTTGSLLMSSPPPPPLEHHRVPTTQPHPGFETPSAFAPPPTTSAAAYPQYAASAPAADITTTARAGQPHSPHNAYPSPLAYRYTPARPASRPTLESAIENVQAHLAALTERIESLETRMLTRSHSHVSPTPRGRSSPGWFNGRGSPHDPSQGPRWNIDDMGLWSMVLNPLSRGIDQLRHLSLFFAENENRTPAMIIVRRLCLDVSFLVCVVALIGALWRKSGVRRREVRAALVVLWRAIIGSNHQRTLHDRGV